MSRTIRQMQNEITRLKRNENLIPPHQDMRVPPQNQRDRNDRNQRNEEHRPRAPRVPNPNVVVLEEITEEENFVQNNDSFDQEFINDQDQILESVQMEEISSSFQIFDEQEDYEYTQQDNVVHTRTQANKFKTKETRKEKEKDNLPEPTKQQPIVNQTKTSLQMTYNVVDELTRLWITLPFMEVVKIPQQRENMLNILDDTSLSNPRIEATVINTKQQYVPVKPRGKIPPFYISLENHDLKLHNCLVDSGATNNIMPLSIMEALGMECTKYYETGESIYAIDSRKVPAYGEIKDFCAWISVAPHITTIFTIIVVDFPPAYGVVLGWDWCSMIGGYIMNDGSCMMLPNKDGTMIRVPWEQRNPTLFEKKEIEMFQNYIDVGIGNYVVFNTRQMNLLKLIMKQSMKH
jgi:hypothetical protein